MKTCVSPFVRQYCDCYYVDEGTDQYRLIRINFYSVDSYMSVFVFAWVYYMVSYDSNETVGCFVLCLSFVFVSIAHPHKPMLLCLFFSATVPHHHTRVFCVPSYWFLDDYIDRHFRIQYYHICFSFRLIVVKWEMDWNECFWLILCLFVCLGWLREGHLLPKNGYLNEFYISFWLFPTWVQDTQFFNQKKLEIEEMHQIRCAISTKLPIKRTWTFGSLSGQQFGNIIW